MFWNKVGPMWKYWMTLCLPLLLCGCAPDLWKDVPEFEVMDFTCPVKGSKFLEDDNYVSGWSVLGPLKPGNDLSIHAELLPEEGLLNGNRRAPRGTTWFRVHVDRSDDEALCGQISFGPKFENHRNGGRRSVFYACATLKCPQDHEGLVMHLVALGKIKVWINGKAVYASERGSGSMKAEPVLVRDLSLVKGCNRLVVKYMDDGDGPSRGRVFSLRFTDAAGNLSTVR